MRKHTFPDFAYISPRFRTVMVVPQTDSFSCCVNLSTLLFKKPLADAPKQRTVILQEAIGDSQVPNLCSRILARAMGVEQMLPAVERINDLQGIMGPTQKSVLSQVIIPDMVTAHLPPESNTIPDKDNGVHFNGVVIESNLQQLRHLLSSGEVKHFCEGPCDPN